MLLSSNTCLAFCYCSVFLPSCWQFFWLLQNSCCFFTYFLSAFFGDKSKTSKDSVLLAWQVVWRFFAEGHYSGGAQENQNVGTYSYVSLKSHFHKHTTLWICRHLTVFLKSLGPIHVDIQHRYRGHLVRHFCQRLPGVIQCALP